MFIVSDLKPRLIGGLLAATFTLFSPPGARAADLDVDGWLARPGVRLLAVEFFAADCKSCVRSMTKWRSLRKKYKNNGLKLVVVSARTKSGRCADPGWDPDQVICDDQDGSLAKKFGVTASPSTFLWNWQGDMLVDNGKVDEVASKTRGWLKSTPKVEVEVTGLDPQAGLSARTLTQLIQTALKGDDRFAVLTSAKALAKLEEKKASAFESGYANAPRCESNSARTENALLQAAVSAKKEDVRLAMDMLSLEGACLMSSSNVKLNKDKPVESIVEVFEMLNKKLRHAALLPQANQPQGAVVSAGAPQGQASQAPLGLAELPEIGTFTAKIPKTDLRNVDLGYLKLLQLAQRADKNGKLSDQEKAAAWDAVAKFGGLNPLQLEAERRRDEWLGLQEARQRRIDDIKRVDKEEREDRQKLDAILAMDNSVISPVQKQAYRDEFDRTYAPWRDALAEWRGSRTAAALRKNRELRASTEKAKAPAAKQKIEVVPEAPAKGIAVSGMNNLLDKAPKNRQDEIADLESMLRMKPKTQRGANIADLDRVDRRKTLRFSVGRKALRYPGYLVSGITFDDRGHLRAADWSQGVGPKRIYEIRPNDGKLIGSIPAPSDWTGGLAFANGYLWAAANSKLHRVNPRNGRVNKRIKLWSEQAYGRGLGFDGRHFWFADQNDRSKKRKKPGEIELVHPTHGRTVQVLKSPSRNGGMTFDGKNVWYVSGEHAVLHKINPKTGKSVASYPIHGVPEGAFAHDLAWDGRSLWISMAKTRAGRRGFDNWIMRIDAVQVDELEL